MKASILKYATLMSENSENRCLRSQDALRSAQEQLLGGSALPDVPLANDGGGGRGGNGFFFFFSE